MLDQSPIAQGSTGTQALERTLELARLADGLGYHRFWVAEHHGTPMLAGAAPEAVIGPIAATTARIRVGSGGVMLHHYSPRKVAETFSVLGGMFRGRIDVGIGRGADADPVTTHALQRDRRVPDPQDYADQLAELVAYLDDRPPPDRRFAGLASLPGLLPEPCPCEDLAGGPRDQEASAERGASESIPRRRATPLLARGSSRRPTCATSPRQALVPVLQFPMLSTSSLCSRDQCSSHSVIARSSPR